MKVKETALIAMFSALAVAGGFLFIAVPNVEVFTATVFLSGIILGSRKGLIVGFIAQTLFSTFNPYGISPLPLFVAQVAHRMIVGFWGGRFSGVIREEKKMGKVAVKFGAVGLFITLLYIIMTFLSYLFVMGLSVEQMKLQFAGGFIYYLIHIAGNTLIFAIVIPLLLGRLARTELLNPAGLK